MSGELLAAVSDAAVKSAEKAAESLEKVAEKCDSIDFDPDECIEKSTDENIPDGENALEKYDPDDRLEPVDVQPDFANERIEYDPDERIEEKREISSPEHDADGDNTEQHDGPYKETVDGTTYYYDDNGNLYRIDDDLLPNSEYELNGYNYTTDDMGRITNVEGTLHMKDREGRLTIRDSLESIGKGDEKETDDRGHLIGDQFDGTNGLENMIPQDADINRKDFKNFENELAGCVKDGKDVKVEIEVVYDGDSRRPSDIVVKYTIDGEENVKIFPNN